MSWCLTPEAKKKLLEALKKDGDPQKMLDRGSEGRVSFLAEYVGISNAKEINSLFESKMLLKNQINGFISFAKRLGGNKYVKRDFISKVKSLDKALSKKEVDQFLESYASKRLGLEISEEQYKGLQEGYKKIEETSSVWEAELDKYPEWKKDVAGTKNEWMVNEKALEYGFAKVAFKKYAEDLKREAKKINPREAPVEYIAEMVKELPGISKSILAGFLDNSFWGRQGVKTLMDFKTSKIWAKNFVKSFSNIKNQFFAKGKWWESGDDAVMDLTRAVIFASPNSMNGKYAAGGYGLDVLKEEAFPSSRPEKIPGLARIFKTTAVIYDAGALQLRADLADRMIALAEDSGINPLDRTEAKYMGRVVSSMTGRGHLGKLESVSKEINDVFFSVKFMKSTWDILTAPVRYAKEKTWQKLTGKEIEGEFAKRESAKSTLRIIATIATILMIAKRLDPDSVDEDPRSTNFGKIKIFGLWTDITGGLAGLSRLIARVTPTKRNGELGFWSKSSTGNWVNMMAGGFGVKSALDTIENYFENKTAPVASIVRDILRGRNFDGEKVTLKNALESITTPITIQNFDDIRENPNTDWILGSMILEGLGFSVSTYHYKANWNTSTSKILKQFKEQVGDEKFKKANEEYNRAYNFIMDGLENDKDYKKLSDDAKKTAKSRIKSNVQDKIFEEYDFEYEKEDKTDKEIEDADTIKDILNKL